MIQQNALKLNALILELIEFRRLETGEQDFEDKNMFLSQNRYGLLPNHSESWRKAGN